MFFLVNRAIYSHSRSEIFEINYHSEDHQILTELQAKMEVSLKFAGADSPNTICSGAPANALLKMQMCTSDCEFFDLAQQQKYVG